jgi:hypothetical protein
VRAPNTAIRTADREHLPASAEDTMMDCQEFERAFEDYLGERLPAAAWDDARAHWQSCTRCQQRHPYANDPMEAPPLGAADQETLVEGVLARTSGAPCRRAEWQLGAFLDADLPADDAELVADHLAHCAGCRQLAETMSALRTPLREMAEIDPGPEFTAMVMRATSGTLGLEPAAPDRARAVSRILERGVELWRRWSARPRFALEAAYVATVILIVLFGTPLSPLVEAPAQAMHSVEHHPAVLIADLTGTMASGAETPGMDSLRGSITQLSFVRWPRQQIETLSGRWRLLSAAAGDLTQHGGALGQAFWNGDEAATSRELQILARDLRRLRDALVGGSETADSGADDVHRTDVQPTNAQPTNGQRTNAQATDAQPTDAQPTDAQPTNAPDETSEGSRSGDTGDGGRR